MSTLSLSPLTQNNLSQTSQQTFSVRWVSINEFQHDLSNPDSSFQERLKHFLNKLTPIYSADGSKLAYHQLWINFPKGTFSPFQDELDLELIVKAGKFESNTLTAKSGGELTTPYFFHLKIFAEDDRSAPLAAIRFNPEGTKGELVYIQKGKHLTGTQMSDLTFMILNFLKVDFVYLNDDAHFPVQVPGTTTTLELPIRMYLPIMSSQGETWYGKRKFSPLSCHQLQTSDKSVIKTQDPTQYYEAVKNVRDISLAILYREVLNPEAQKELITLCQRYLPSLNMTNINQNIRRLASVTLHQLGNALYNSMRTAQGQIDFITFTQKIIAMNPDNPHPFYRSLDVIYDTCIWKFSYSNPLENTSFSEYESIFQ